MSLTAETEGVHTRLLKCALEIEESRAYWAQTTPDAEVSAQQAFEAYWFGAKSLPRVQVLLTNFRARFAAFPEALAVLHAWDSMEHTTRALICHWHLQLSDPMYRAFTGSFLLERRELRPEITHARVVAWVGEQGGSRWTLPTRIQLAGKLLSAAHSAGLVGSIRDPRPLVFPRVPDDALSYLMYLLRGVQFQGSLLDNPYTASVGLDADALAVRLRVLAALRFRQQGDIFDLGWCYPTLTAWAAAEGILPPAEVSA